MDPLSVAGLAIGVVGLTFQLFSGCVTGSSAPLVHAANEN